MSKPAQIFTVLVIDRTFNFCNFRVKYTTHINNKRLIKLDRKKHSMFIGPAMLHFAKYEDTCNALRDLVPFVHFKKREKHPWRSANFSKVAGFSLSRFLNFTNGTKSRNASHIC